jgi:predicted GNAT superfamily acetyltransferase
MTRALNEFATTSKGLTIRALKTAEEYHQAEAVQRAAWSIQDSTEVVPLHLLLTAQKNGGLVLGAFDEKGEMIGFLFGFPGRTDDGRWKHCSHMMGIVPDRARRGVGEALKRRQRDFALSQGLDLITWTFDPLEGANASLNFGKLGVICGTYLRNLYGAMADELNHGLPSDRFEVEWLIASRQVKDRLHSGPQRERLAELHRLGARLVNDSEVRDGWRYPREADLRPVEPFLLVEIPASFQAIKASSMRLAQEWRQQTRMIFETYFQAGYLVTDFLSEQMGEARRNFYLLSRSE